MELILLVELLKTRKTKNQNTRKGSWKRQVRLDKLYKRNTNPNLYSEDQECQNCGSFALGVNGWYCPYIEDDDDTDGSLWQYTDCERNSMVTEMIDMGRNREYIMEVLIERDWEFILKTCPWLVPIKEEEIDGKDRVIAYRLSMDFSSGAEDFDMEEDADFHFRVMIDGEWWEKNGGGPVHAVEDFDNWTVEKWLVYDGPIKYAKFRVEV